MSRTNALVLALVVALIANVAPALTPLSAWALPAFVQTANNGNSGTTCTLSVSVGATGHGWAVIASDDASTSQTYTIADGAGNSYNSPIVDFQGGNARLVKVWAVFDATPTTSITVTASSTDAYSCVVVEFDKADTVDTCDTYDNPAQSNQDGSLAGINTTTDVFVIAGGRTAANTTHTANASYTAAANFARILVEYRASAGALTAETGRWTQSVSTRQSTNFICSFKDTGAPASASSSGMLLLGVR